jgi:hypothetical protein
MPRLLIALCSLTLLAGALQAEENSAAPTPLSVSVEREPINTVEPIYRSYVSVGRDKFTFIIPEKFHTTGDPAHGKLQLSNVGGDCIITFSILGPVPAESRELRPEPYREMWSRRHENENVKFVGEFSGSGANCRGPGFDLEWKNGTNLTQRTRAVYLPSMAGVLEITVTCGAKNFKTAQSSLESLLGTLVASVNGKLEVPRLADRM